MRVLYYTDSLRLGGKERQLVELLKGLKQAGIELTARLHGPGRVLRA